MKRGAVAEGPGFFRAKAVPLAKLLGPFENELRKPVADKTGLTGLYDVELNWTPEALANLAATLPADGPVPRRLDTGGPNLFKAIQDQLGLKLEQTTGPVEAIVIEKVERPSEN